MREIEKSDWVAIAGAVLFINLLTLWCIDVSLIALINEAIMATYQALGNTGILLPMDTGMVNGIFEANPALTYHIALYLNAGLSFFMFLIMIHVVMKNGKKKE